MTSEENPTSFSAYTVSNTKTKEKKNILEFLIIIKQFCVCQIDDVPLNATHDGQYDGSSCGETQAWSSPALFFQLRKSSLAHF